MKTRMMTTIIAIFLLQAWDVQAVHSAFAYRFVEVKKIKELESLPPQLQLIFDRMCNEDYVQTIRVDTTDPKTQKVTVNVGVLVKPNLLSSCAGVKKEQTVDAGNLFSGRAYEVVKIKK